MYAGSLVALVTPMQPNGGIDFDAWSRLLEFQVSNGTSGIVVAGSTGESAFVTDAELAELLSQARRVIGRRALLVANTGTNDTRSACDRAREFSSTKYDVDGLLVATRCCTWWKRAKSSERLRWPTRSDRNHGRL